MTASTIEHPNIWQHQPAQLTGADQLTRDHDGWTLPAAGDWIIGRGQRVCIARRGLRRRRLEAVVVDGVFSVADDPIASSLAATLRILDSGATVQIGPATVRSLTVGYHGVFGRRRQRSIWLDVRAELDPSAITEWLGRGPIFLHAQLNVGPVSTPSDASAGRSAVDCVWHLHA